MEIKKGTKLKLKWQFLNEGEPVSLSDFSKFRLDVLDVRSVPQRTSVALSDNEAVFTIDTAKYENGRYSVCVDADGPNGGLHICHRNAFRIVPANAKSSLAKGGNGANIELTIQDDLSGQTQSVVEEQDPTVPDHVKAITQQNITDWGKNIFWCEFGVTTFEEISTAISKGRIPMLVNRGNYYILNSCVSSSVFYFTAVGSNGTSFERICLYKDDGRWGDLGPVLIQQRSLKSSWSSSPKDSNYPSEKLVFESLSSKQDKLPSLEGNAGKVLRVKSDETGVEWVSID